MTIDGEDARDFDDAVYCEREDDHWRLVVAIADVSHYVQPDSAPGQGSPVARHLGVFPGEVIPMLPEALSNGLCH
ncbi:MAG: RNB domain-containing ribonuclease [Thiolinea sp.]